MRFKEFINEGFNLHGITKLYHISPIESAINILKYDYFRTSHGIIGLQGLSTTFDKNYSWGGKGVKFVIDANKISKDYRLKYIDEKLKYDNKTRLKEYEIKILSDSAITNIHQYLIKIEYSQFNNELLKELQEYNKKFGIPVVKV